MDYKYLFWEYGGGLLGCMLFLGYCMIIAYGLN